MDIDGVCFVVAEVGGVGKLKNFVTRVLQLIIEINNTRAL